MNNFETTTYRNPRKFGGLISASDFSTCYKGHRGIAEQIISDWKFDKQCLRNYENKNREYTYKVANN